MSMRIKVLMVGPLPPPRGGVANFVQNIQYALSSNPRYTVEVFRTGPKGSRTLAIEQPLQDLGRMVHLFDRPMGIEPDIIHIHTSSYYSFYRNIPYVAWAQGMTDARLIVHIHGGKFMRFYYESSAPIRQLVKRTLRKADAIIVTSPYWVDNISTIVGSERQVLALPNGFDPGTFFPVDRTVARQRLGIPEDRKVLVTVGYLEEVKGHRHLIDAMPGVLEQGDVHLYIIGDGSLREQLTSQARSLGVEGSVSFFHEPLSPSGVALWMNASDVFVLPSLNEGNPTVMFECMGCGRPFVGSRVGGIPDVISSDLLGLMCEPADSEGLTNAIGEALERDWDPSAISNHAQRYSWKSIASDLSSLYGDLLEKRM